MDPHEKQTPSGERETRYRRYEAAGEASIRAELDEASPADAETFAKRAWLFQKEEGRQDEQRKAMFASVAAANDAAQIARDSAEASRRSAFWTMIAALAATAGVLVNAAIALGWLDWLKHAGH